MERREEQLETRITRSRLGWKSYVADHQSTWDADRAELAAQAATVTKDLLGGRGEAFRQQVKEGETLLTTRVSGVELDAHAESLRDLMAKN